MCIPRSLLIRPSHVTTYWSFRLLISFVLYWTDVIISVVTLGSVSQIYCFNLHRLVRPEYFLHIIYKQLWRLISCVISICLFQIHTYASGLFAPKCEEATTNMVNIGVALALSNGTGSANDIQLADYLILIN